MIIVGHWVASRTYAGLFNKKNTNVTWLNMLTLLHNLFCVKGCLTQPLVLHRCGIAYFLKLL